MGGANESSLTAYLLILLHADSHQVNFNSFFGHIVNDFIGQLVKILVQAVKNAPQWEAIGLQTARAGRLHGPLYWIYVVHVYHICFLLVQESFILLLCRG